MSLSSSTLIHFSGSKEALKSILVENFKLFNCKETIVFNGKKPTCFYVPMVSFCDIPLSKIKDHIDKYGTYGIGLTKDWAVRNGLNPVLYVSKNSSLANSYKTAYNHYITSNLSDLSDATKSLADVVRYIKNYEGDLNRKGTTINDYRFSDEREWRYVPSHTDYPDMFVGHDWYTHGENKKDCDLSLEGLRLVFEPNDIKYIIINNDSEISEFVNHLRKAKGTKYSYDDVERLTTRILTAEQIRADI